MSKILSNDLFLIVTVSFCVFLICYLYVDKIIAFLYQKSLGQREEVIRLLDLMFVDIDRKRITITMLLLSFGIGTVMFFVLLPNVIAGFIVASICVVAGWSAPILVIRYLYDQRNSKFVAQMVDGLTIMANGIKSGLSVTQSMERVVDNLHGPIGQEFSLVLSQIRLGRSIEEALIELTDRIPVADVQMFVTAVNILKETGGNLAETFSTIVLTIRERQKIEKKIQAMTAQGLMQGIIITLVPIVLIIVFMIVDPSYFKPMFSTTLGLVLLAIMFALQIIGGLTIRKIVKISV